jgi:hypothetical protein
VLDQDGDGVQVTRPFRANKSRFTFDWTKQFEGADALTDSAWAGGLNGKDADLVYADYSHTTGALTLNPYFAFYNDAGWEDGTTYLPNHLQYNLARFQPNVSRAAAFGLSFNAKHRSLTLKGEGAYLTGEDKVANTHSLAGQLLDVNNGDLRGYTAFADAKLAVGKNTFGVVFGIGSGDDDPMSGRGNIVRVRTQGFFYVNEIWEDSIMPDEAGITPQGLGSPGSRGYREFENTTLFQVNYARPLRKDLKLFLSGSYMRATEALRPWSDLNGDTFIGPGEFGAASSTDLGTEADFLVDWDIMPNVVWTLRGGVMFPGDAAGYLLNGTNRFLDEPWEIRTTVRFNFSGLRLR